MASTDETTIHDEIEEVYDETPFLRITSTTTKDDGRYDTIIVELSVGDDETLGDADPDEHGSARSWLIDLVAATVREMRGAGQPPDVVVSGAAMQTGLAGHVRHTEGCDGSCGLPPAGSPVESLDLSIARQAGGDRKDEV